MARARLARLAAPAAFLLAVTVAVLLVRGALEAEDTATAAATTTASTPAPPPPPPPPATTRGTQPASTAGQEFYVIRAGDTLGTVANAYGTTVDELVELNPGIDPTALQVGQRIRVE